MAEPGGPPPLAAPFVGNDYRKRVLAAVERRGGPAASDPFELYDLDPAAFARPGRAGAGAGAGAGVGSGVDDGEDAAVAARVAEVWAFWQRQRDHPKYRVLVAELVTTHPQRSAELLDPTRRAAAAARVLAQRERRDAERYALLDAAISRLVARHGAVPGGKLDGLYEVGALAGLDRAEVAARLRRHRIADPEPAGGTPRDTVGPERRRQLRTLLAEFGRLTEPPAPPTLLALLELPPTASDAEIRARAAAWRARARELPPGRLRAVVDELLVHVAELLEPGRAAVAAYLAAVGADVAEHLRPLVRAAVLVEDRLIADDRRHLVGEAVGLGLDRGRAERLVARLVEELGAVAEADGEVDGEPPAR